MTTEELKHELNQLENRYRRDKKDALTRYALSNNTLKVGDIATDHMGSVVIEEIKIDINSVFSDLLAQCVYIGQELKKNGQPTTKQKRRDVYQSNLVTK